MAVCVCLEYSLLAVLCCGTFFFLFGACSDITGNTVNQREAAVHSERLDRVCGAMEIVSFSFFLFFFLFPFFLLPVTQGSHVSRLLPHIFFSSLILYPFLFILSLFYLHLALFSFFLSSHHLLFGPSVIVFSFLSLMRNTESSGSKSQKCYGNL